MEAEIKKRRLKWLGSMLRMEDGRLPKLMLFGELKNGKRSCGGQPIQWAAVLLRDMIDFGWIERKEAPAGGASKTKQDKAWKEYKELIWKEIATIKSPKVWKNMLVAGVDHSWVTGMPPR
jgi:hypothetical protein